jgi:hypothetical protein
MTLFDIGGLCASLGEHWVGRRLLLDHRPGEMTAYYARPSGGHWENARKVNTNGETVTNDRNGPLAEANRAKQRLGRVTQRCPTVTAGSSDENGDLSWIMTNFHEIAPNILGRSIIGTPNRHREVSTGHQSAQAVATKLRALLVLGAGRDVTADRVILWPSGAAVARARRPAPYAHTRPRAQHANGDAWLWRPSRSTGRHDGAGSGQLH